MGDSKNIYFSAMLRYLMRRGKRRWGFRFQQEVAVSNKNNILQTGMGELASKETCWRAFGYLIQPTRMRQDRCAGISWYFGMGPENARGQNGLVTRMYMEPIWPSGHWQWHYCAGYFMARAVILSFLAQLWIGGHDARWACAVSAYVHRERRLRRTFDKQVFIATNLAEMPSRSFYAKLLSLLSCCHQHP